MSQFIFNLIIYLIIAFPGLYFLGRFFLGKYGKKLEPHESIFISLTLGILIIILETIIFGFLKVRSFGTFFLISVVILSILRNHKSFINDWKSLFKNKILIGILFLGILVQGQMNFPSGWQFQNGINFWSSQGHDGLWHVSLMEEIKENFPPSQPLYAGHSLQNYHFTSDIFMGEFYRIFPNFTALDLYFRFYPILFSLLIGLGVFSLAARRWNSKAAIWSMFFTYFCGSLGYIVAIYKHQFVFSGESLFWASQGNTILGNPPHAMGIFMLTAVVFLFIIWTKTKEKFWLFLMFLFGFGLASVKVSSGITLVAGLFAVGGFALVFRKQWTPLIAGFVLAATNYTVLKIISPNASSFLVFNPLWFPRTMMVVKLDWVEWELRRQHYIWVNTWRSWLREISLETQAILYFIIGNTGIRILSLGEIFVAVKKKILLEDIFMFGISLSGILVVLIFVQSGVTYNLIQFVQIYLHFTGIYAGAFVWRILTRTHKPVLKYSLAIIIVMLAIPTTIGGFFDFYGPNKKPLSFISNNELAGLNWLKVNSPKDSIILTKSFDNDLHYRYKEQPIPISAWYPTMYVHSISQRRTYLTGEEQLNITGYKTEDNLAKMKAFMKQTDIKSNNAFLAESNIDYIYLRKEEIDTPIDVFGNNLTEVFSNDEVIIYHYDKK